MYRKSVLRKSRKFAVPLLAATFILLGLLASQSVLGGEDTTAPKATGQVTFLYYADLAKAADFYGNVMGFENTFLLHPLVE
ncbi:MAG: hypothetical protein RQ826_17420 [Xanthomonadales bacterium]|nr:hypothetical protein [Xanthomonadales bacterium]